MLNHIIFIQFNLETFQYHSFFLTIIYIETSTTLILFLFSNINLRSNFKVNEEFKFNFKVNR